MANSGKNIPCHFMEHYTVTPYYIIHSHESKLFSENISCLATILCTCTQIPRIHSKEDTQKEITWAEEEVFIQANFIRMLPSVSSYQRRQWQILIRSLISAFSFHPFNGLHRLKQGRPAIITLKNILHRIPKFDWRFSSYPQQQGDIYTASLCGELLCSLYANTGYPYT